MYRLIFLLIVLFITSGCSKNENVSKNDKITIVTTNFPPYDFVREIAGENVNVKMLLKPGEESHTYEPTPKDIITIQNSDLFIYVGGENDFWVEDILNSMTNNKPDTLKLIDIVPTVKEELVEGMEDIHLEDGHNHLEDEHTIDEHVWTSPKNAIKIVEKITNILIEKDSKNTQLYKNNSSYYIQKLEDLDLQFRQIVDNSNKNVILFGDRFPFRYFADEYNINYYAAFSGCSTETEASPKTIAFLINKVREESIPVVFTIEFSNGKIADAICEATQTKKLLFNSGHNITKEQLENNITYLSLMQENAKSLKEALN